MSGKPQEPRRGPRSSKRKNRRRRGSRATAPLEARPKLDLSRPLDQPLADDELREATAHLAFLNRFKRSLRLSLNAAEDLLVNGARPPSERGVLKHLFGKVDRQVVEQALARAPLSTDDTLRATFLAGVVRLRPSHDTLLSYLAAVAKTSDRQDAARAFALTVDRMSFDDVSPAALLQLVKLVRDTFTGPERIRAYLGLFAAPRFREAWRALRDVEPALRAELGPLEAAYAVVADEAPIPEGDQERHIVQRGLSTWLDAPAAILASYPDDLRARLAITALNVLDGAPPRALSSLVSSLSKSSSRHEAIGLAYAAALARHGDTRRAAQVVRPLAQARPNDTRLRRIEEALGWPVVGAVAIAPSSRSLRPAYALNSGWFGWARTAPASAAGELVAETRLMLDLLVPGVATVLDHGLAKDGTAYVFVVGEGHALDEEHRTPRLDEALLRADTAVRTMRTLTAFGIELTDVALDRFLVSKGGLLLADLRGARAADPAHAALTNGPLARRIATALCSSEGALRADLPPELRARLESPTPLPVLVRALATARLALGPRRRTS